MEQEETLCDEVKTVIEFTYLGDRVSRCGGREAAVTARTRCEWVTFRECGDLLYRRRIPLWQEMAAYKGYARRPISHMRGNGGA